MKRKRRRQAILAAAAVLAVLSVATVAVVAWLLSVPVQPLPAVPESYLTAALTPTVAPPPAPVTPPPSTTSEETAENEADEENEANEESTETPADPPAATPPPPAATEMTDTVNETEAKAAEIIATMTLREKICQMLIVTPDAITGVSGTTVAGAATKAALEKYPVGGLVFFDSNISSGEQILAFNQTVQTYTKIPLFLSVDEEGGRVGRLKSRLGAHAVRAMLGYEAEGEEAAYDNAVTLAETLQKYGFNTDFAPVADVWSNTANTVIGDRAYSKDFDSAAVLVAAAVRGFADKGVVCSLKHFPGHGSTTEDSHSGLAYVNKTLGELRGQEFKPFAAGIAAGADMVMVGHLVVKAADTLPAPLSEVLVSDILRDELGFSGVVVTDSLVMRAMTANYSSEHIAVTAVLAGVDILLMPASVERTIAALEKAVESGEIPESRIDESVKRIIALKVKRGIITI